MRLRMLAEMPMQYHIGGEFTKFPKRTPYTMPKFYELLSKQLSGWTGRSLIFLGGAYFEQRRSLWDRLLKRKDERALSSSIQYLSRVTGIPVETFQSSITIMLSEYSGQVQLSPWLLLHQLAEELTRLDSIDHRVHDLWFDTIAPKYETVFQSIWPDDQDDNESLPANAVAYYALFKMRSARERNVGDHAAELITEFMWHRGRIRINYPDGMDRDVVNNIKLDVETEINKILDTATGRVLYRVKFN